MFAGFRVVLLPDPKPGYWRPEKPLPWSSITTYRWMPPRERVLPLGDVAIIGDSIHAYRPEYTAIIKGVI